eukprot:1148374-Pelagomonas_calceolata.AAC.2
MLASPFATALILPTTLKAVLAVFCKRAGSRALEAKSNAERQAANHRTLPAAGTIQDMRPKEVKVPRS